MKVLSKRYEPTHEKYFKIRNLHYFNLYKPGISLDIQLNSFGKCTTFELDKHMINSYFWQFVKMNLTRGEKVWTYIYTGRVRVFLGLIIILSSIFAQENSLIEEMQKIEDEFKTAEPVTDEIPQSKLIEEMSKPGNESLLEQIKNSLGEESFDIDLQKDESDLESSDSEKNQDLQDLVDDEDKKLKVSSISEKMFDIDEYYNSIKDFYGYKIFINPDVESKKPRPVIYSARNENHIITPGESFFLTVWGDTKFQRRLEVSGEGTIYIDDVGVFPVHGLTIVQLEKKLKKLLSMKYKTINPDKGEPTTFFDVYFDKLNTLTVFVSGEVVSQGPYEMSPNSSILSLLINAKGVTPKGSLRNIKLIRNGSVIKNFDVYEYLQKGDEIQDVILRDGDKIFVPTRHNTISLQGEVLNPLKYELKDNETLADLIMYSGGLLSSASTDKVQIERLTPIQNRESPVVFSRIFDFDFVSIINDNKIVIEPVKLYDRDIVTIHSIPRILTDYVALDGAVYRKGRFEFKEGMRMSDLLSYSGGLLADAYTEKVELVRTFPDQSKLYKSISLEEGFKDFNLSNLDSIKVWSNWVLNSKKVVTINGYIKEPGFVYLADSMKVSDLIFSRGGLVDEWRRNRTYLLRAELTRFLEGSTRTRIITLNLNKILEGDKSEDLFLKDGDQLRIFDINLAYNEERVFVSGYVKNEGEYELSTNMTVEDLILKANGFKEGAFEGKAIVFRMNNSEVNDSLSLVYEIDISDNYFKISGSRESEFLLKNKDHVVIRKDPYYRDVRKITLFGEVKFPGVYSLITEYETLRDIIERAGGLTSEAFIEGSILTRDTMKIVSDFKKAYEKNKNYGITLKDGDGIYIPKHPGTVTVEGYVYTPGLIKYRKDWGLNDYIEAAGGRILDVDYQAGKAVTYYPGGNAKVDNGWFFKPEVKEGSRIFVPQVRKEPDKDWRAEMRAWLGILTTSLTVVVLIDAVYDK